MDLREKLGRKISHHLIGLDETRKADKQKILELCQIGKLLATYYPDFEIVELCERPDFLISNGTTQIALEHQLILDSKSKEKEGFYMNICEKVEEELKKDIELPNFLVTLYMKKDVSQKLQDKLSIISTLSMLVKHFVLTDELIQNDFVDKAVKTNHSSKTVDPNFGAYWQKSITEKLILESIERKESKINDYRQNLAVPQWLVLVIGGLGESSFEVNSHIKIGIDTKFDKIFLYEDFANQLYELV